MAPVGPDFPALVRRVPSRTADGRLHRVRAGTQFGASHGPRVHLRVPRLVGQRQAEGCPGSGDHVNTDAVVKLLAAMRERARPIKPKDLGIIGEDHLRARFETIGAALESFNYRKVEVEHDGLPYLIEFAFGYCPKSKNGRRIITGINWSASVGGNPFRNLSTAGESLDSILTEQRAGGNEPIVMVLHLVCPRVEHLDRGKTCIAIPGRIAATIVDLVRSGTKRWCDQRKAEERHERTKANRDDRLIHFKVHKATIKDVAYEVMRRAYMAASTNGTLPANARQIYYAARGEILERTGKDNLDSQYFCQTLLVDYVRETGVDWDIIWDDRGHFTEPHTKHMFGLGTLNVRKYLAKIGAPCFIRPSFGGGGVDTRGPDGRFGAVLFIEKEGFMPLFERVHLAERHDIAIMSTKGMSVTAARILVDKMCGRYKIPVYVLHDFDVSGFSIFGTLRGNTDRYTFNNAIKVVDLGLRLTDVEALGLQSEQVSLGNTDRHKIRRRLERNGATAAEVESLLTERRVELNAMTSRELVDFVERKLRENGVMKIVPDQKRLATAYRLFHRNERLQKVVDATIKASTEDDIAVPDDLAERVKGRLSDTSMSWDEVIARIATTAPLADDGLADIPIVVIVPTLEGEFERRYWNSPLFDEGEDELPAVLTIDGRTLTISEWAREANIHPRVLEARIRAGWHPDWILIPFPGMTYWEG